MSVVRSDIGIEKVYRIFSKFIVNKIINTNITPNNLSWISFFLIVVSIPFTIFKEHIYFNIISFALINLSLSSLVNFIVSFTTGFIPTASLELSIIFTFTPESN